MDILKSTTEDLRGKDTAELRTQSKMYVSSC